MDLMFVESLKFSPTEPLEKWDGQGRGYHMIGGLKVPGCPGWSGDGRGVGARRVG